LGELYDRSKIKYNSKLLEALTSKKTNKEEPKNKYLKEYQPQIPMI